LASEFSTVQTTKIALAHLRGRDSVCPKCRDGVVRVKPKLLPGPRILVTAVCPMCHASGKATSDDYRAMDLPRWTQAQANRIVAGALKWEEPTCPVDNTPLHIDRSQKGHHVVVAAFCPRCLNETVHEDKST